MNTTFRNKMTMYDTVTRVIAANETSWIGIPAFQSAFQEFNASLNSLKLLVEEHGRIITGITRAKNAVKSDLADNADRFASLLRVYAENNQLAELEAQVHINLSALRGMAGSALLAYSKTLESLVEEHGIALEAFGYQAGELPGFTALIESYSEVLVTPRIAIVNRRQITLSISTQIKALDALLKKKLDPLASTLKFQAPDFANVYKSARNIVQLHGKRNATGTDPGTVEGSDGD